ncbi:MAG: carbamate kinase [Candidatus Neomarinimicrobiota bacterium]
MIAFGGNALSPRGEVGTITQQFAKTRESLSQIMHFVEHDYKICITHGNGPQVGDELLRMDLTHNKLPPLPLGVCVAGTQGTIGYMIQQSLQNILHRENIKREVVTIITQVVVDEHDPANKKPDKFIGHRYTKEKITELAEKFNWQIAEQNPGKWRRVVPSPLPQYIRHGISVKKLVDHGTIVLAAGGGGIPVYFDKNHNLEGLDAVIDKDYSAALLGRVLKAEELWIITDIDHAYLNFNKPDQKKIGTVSSSQAQDYLASGHFQSGSMKPKIEAGLYFLRHHGEKVVITSISNIKDAINGKSGTIIRK